MPECCLRLTRAPMETGKHGRNEHLSAPIF
jgi:hypothetical protein